MQQHIPGVARQAAALREPSGAISRQPFHLAAVPLVAGSEHVRLTKACALSLLHITTKIRGEDVLALRGRHPIQPSN